MLFYLPSIHCWSKPLFINVRLRDVLRRIQTLHPQPVKQTEVLELQQLEACIKGKALQWSSEQLAVQLLAARNQTLILMGFWRVLRCDEFCQLRVEHIRRMK